MKRLVGMALLIGAAGASLAGVQFGEPIKLGAGTFPSAVTALDLNGDSHLDLVVVNRNSDDADVYLGDGAGGFTFSQDFAVGNFPQGVIAVDLNGDGTQDLVTTAVEFSFGNVKAWLSNGDGTLQSPFVMEADDGTRAVRAADLDHNGTLDLVATNPTRGNIGTFLGDGDGTFDPELRTLMGSLSAYPTDLAIADFNEDGHLDVITSNAQSADQSLGLVLGHGDGTFGAATAFLTGCLRPESVQSGDFNRDGHVDVAVACAMSAEVVVQLGDGAGSLAAPQPYDLSPDAGNPYWIQSQDFDRDGKLDLMTANNGSYTILRGKGDGTFVSPQTEEAVPGSFAGGTAADFNGDGWVDVAIANSGQSEVWVYLNQTALCGAALCPLTLGFGAGSTDLAWAAAPNAVGYDLVRGSLNTLLSSAGDYSLATQSCVASMLTSASATATSTPAAGEGYWYLVREIGADGAGSYDDHSGSLSDGRDAGIAASGFDCP